MLAIHLSRQSIFGDSVLIASTVTGKNRPALDQMKMATLYGFIKKKTPSSPHQIMNLRKMLYQESIMLLLESAALEESLRRASLSWCSFSGQYFSPDLILTPFHFTLFCIFKFVFLTIFNIVLYGVVVECLPKIFFDVLNIDLYLHSELSTLFQELQNTLWMFLSL